MATAEELKELLQDPQGGLPEEVPFVWDRSEFTRQRVAWGTDRRHMGGFGTQAGARAWRARGQY